MTPYTFRRKETLKQFTPNPKGRVSIHRTINFRGECLFLSSLLAKQMNLHAGNHLSFTLDEDKPEHVFVRKADDADDTKDIQYSLSLARHDRRVLRCSNVAVVRHVLSVVGAAHSCTCHVSPEPTNINGKDHFMILLACPVQIK